jgi:hypothetical protein
MLDLAAAHMHRTRAGDFLAHADRYGFIAIDPDARSGH